MEDSARRNRNIAGKVLALALAAIVVLVVLQILTREKSSRDEKIVLNMWDLPTTNITNPNVRAERAVYTAFLKRHPNVKIVKTRGIQVEGPAKESAFYMSMAGGTAPDLFTINMRSMGSYIDQGFVRPLEDLIAVTPDAEARMTPVVRPAVSRTLVEKGKPVTHTYAIASLYDVMGFYYRKSLFQDAGLPIDGCPADEWNWGTLWEYSKKLTFPEEGHFGLTVPMGLYGAWMWMNFVWEADGEIVREYAVHPTTGAYIPLPPAGAPDSDWMTPDGVDLRKVRHIWRGVFNEPGGVEALRYYRKLRWGPWTRCTSAACRGKNTCYDITDQMRKAGAARCPSCGEEISIAALEAKKKLYKGVLHLDPTNNNDAPFFTEKRVGMMMWTSEGVYVASTNMNPDEIGLMPCPSGPRGTKANALNATLWGLNSQMTAPNKIQAAWEYIVFQGSQEAEEIRVKTLVEAGHGRYVDPALLRKYGFEDFARHVPRTWVATYEQLKKYGRIEPYAPNYTNVQTSALGVPIDAIFTDENADPKTVLDQAAENVNTTIFQEVPPQVMNHRRRIAWVTATIVGLVLAGVFILAVRSIRDLVAEAASRKAMGLRFAQTSVSAAWAFMLPAVLTILMWSYVPLVRGAAMAFMDYRVIGNSAFVAFDNFILLFADRVFYESMLSTLYYVALTVTFQFAAPLALGLLLAEVPRGKIVYRIIYYLPAVTSGLVIMFLWKQFYDPSTGLFNSILGFFGLEKSDWLTSGAWWVPMVCVVMPMVWAGAGPGALIYLAALKSVPEDIYEAADIDGANFWRKVGCITLPYLKPLIIINFVGVFIGAFEAMQQIFVMTGGGPARATHVIGLEIWYNAYMYLKFGYATAEAWVLGVMLIGFTIYQLQILKKVRFTTAKA